MDDIQISVFEEIGEVSLVGFLESHGCEALETYIGLEILGYHAHKRLEGQLADQKFDDFLVAMDLTEGMFDSAWVAFFQAGLIEKWPYNILWIVE